MTRDDIIRMAREAGLSNDFGHLGYPYLPELERFAALVAAAEREACAKVAERYEPDEKTSYVTYAWQGLTDDEIKEIIGPWGETPIKGYTRKLFYLIEAKLKEKNT